MRTVIDMSKNGRRLVGDFLRISGQGLFKITANRCELVRIGANRPATEELGAIGDGVRRPIDVASTVGSALQSRFSDMGIS